MDKSAFMFDSHAHIISADADKYPPSPISGRLREGAMDNPMTAERLLGEMDAQGVERAALVQRAHVYGFDNSYVVDCAALYPDRFSAICVIDSVSPGARTRAEEWLDRGATGIRLTEPAKGADGAWLHADEARGVWDLVAKHQRTISIQLYTWNRAERMPEVPALAKAFSATPIIVEHLSNITETADAPDFGVDAALDALGEWVNVYLKLTTINLARCRTNGVNVHALLSRLASKFGSERTLWGSDVAQSPQAYADMTAMARAAVAEFGAAERKAVLRDTAERLLTR